MGNFVYLLPLFFWLCSVGVTKAKILLLFKSALTAAAHRRGTCLGGIEEAVYSPSFFFKQSSLPKNACNFSLV